MSQDPVSFTEAEGGLLVAVSSSLTRSSKGILTAGERKEESCSYASFTEIHTTKN